MVTAPAPRRQAARVLAFDANQRLLLFKIEETPQNQGLGRLRGAFWVTPGGELEPGEDFESAARRELHEETGIVCDKLAGCLAIANYTVGNRNVLERYFLAKVADTAIDTCAMNAAERSVLREHRWWLLDELLASEETFVPPQLVTLVREVLLAGVPEVPILLD